MVEIQNSVALTKHFGHWPDFHDAELYALHITTEEEGGQALEALLEVAEISEEVDEAGFFKDHQRCRVVLRFENAIGIAMDGFRHQNVLEALDLREVTASEHELVDPMLSRSWCYARFIPIPGFCELSLFCTGVTVVSAKPVARSR